MRVGVVLCVFDRHCCDEIATSMLMWQCVSPLISYFASCLPTFLCVQLTS